jgi:predicted outer membrane protein
MKALFAALLAGAALLAIGGGAGAAPGSGVDRWWLTGSIQGDRFEVGIGSFAEHWAQTPEVRALAAQLVGDHSHSLGEATALAQQLHFSVPRAPNGLQRWITLTLKAKNRGQGWDNSYAAMEVQDHNQDIADTQLEITSGHVPAVVQLAKKELRMLKVHLMLSQKAWTAST